MQPPAAVAVDGGVRVDIHAAQITDEAALGQRVGAVEAAKLIGHAREDVRHVHVLPPGHAPVLRKPDAQLLPIGLRAKLRVHSRDKGGELIAAVAEETRQVIDIETAVLDHGLRRVVHRGEGIDILRVPAAVLVFAADADLVRRAVKDTGDIFIVARLLDAAAHRFKQPRISLAEIPHAVCREAPQPGFPAAALHVLEHKADMVEERVWQEHEHNGGAEGLKQGVDMHLRRPCAHD